MSYDKFKKPFENEASNTFENEIKKIYLNYRKFINFLEIIKANAVKKISEQKLGNFKLSIKLNIKRIEENINSFDNISCEYTLIYPLFYEIKNNLYKDTNILNIEKYENFERFINDIIEIIFNTKLTNKENEKKNLPNFSVSSIKLNSKNNYSSNTKININKILSRCIKYQKYKILDYMRILGNHSSSAEYIKELSDGTFISGGKDGNVFFYKKFNYKEEIKEEDYLGFLDMEEEKKVVFFSKNNLFIMPYNDKNGKLMNFKENLINIVFLKLKTVFACTDQGIYFLIDFMNTLMITQKTKINEKRYIGGIKVNDKIAAFTSNRLLVNGEDKIFFYNINTKNTKNFFNGYSFTISRNNLSVMDIPKEYNNNGNNKLLFAACKKYIEGQKNGILFLKLEINNNIITKINKVFYNTKNYEVFCFCQIFFVDNNYILNENKNKIQIIDTEYILVGGFEQNKREGLIKLYKVIYNKDYRKIKLEYILDVDVEKYDKENGIQTFKGFKGAINCISQSKNDGNILISCFDGNVYLLTEPFIENILKLNEF